MDVLSRERELCELFKSKNSNENQKVVYTLEANAVTISIFHRGSLDYKRMGFILNILWDNFKLLVTGWKETCSLVQYKKFSCEEDEFPFVAEFKFCIDKFDFNKLRDFDFVHGYRNPYDFQFNFSLYHKKVNNGIRISPDL